MKFDEWDNRISPRLRKMESAAHWLTRDAADLQAAAELLPARPCWQTLGREALNTAEVALRTALAVVLATQDRYDNLPVLIESEFLEPQTEKTENANH